MFPWMMPNATMGGNLSLLSLMLGSGAPGGMSGGNPFGPMQGTLSGPGASFNIFSGGSRADQAPQGNQPDTGNAMAPPGQQPPGGPNPQMAGYDPNTVSPSSQAYGWTPPSWMQALGGNLPSQRGVHPRAGGGSMLNDPRTALQMGAYGLNMMRPPQAPASGPLPWLPIAGGRF